jgi:hypothetical protein
MKLLVACRVSVTYTGALFDNGGDRIAHVDVDHRRLDFLSKEVVKKFVEIDDVSAVTKSKRQPMQLIILDKNNEKVPSHMFATQMRILVHRETNLCSIPNSEPYNLHCNYQYTSAIVKVQRVCLVCVSMFCVASCYVCRRRDAPELLE